MLLKYYTNSKGVRVYTFQKIDPSGVPTKSAHPARYSPVDPYSRERILIKRRFKLLLTQKPAPVY